jgi:hypothetical protein
MQLCRTDCPALPPGRASRKKPGGRFSKAHLEPPLTPWPSGTLPELFPVTKQEGPDSPYTINTATVQPRRTDRPGSPGSRAEGRTTTTLFLMRLGNLAGQITRPRSVAWRPTCLRRRVHRVGRQHTWVRGTEPIRRPDHRLVQRRRAMLFQGKTSFHRYQSNMNRWSRAMGKVRVRCQRRKNDAPAIFRGLGPRWFGGRAQ